MKLVINSMIIYYTQIYVENKNTQQMTYANISKC